MIKKISISEFLSLADSIPVFDVRSPGEYHHAHIPGAYSLPLFTDEERAIVGTAYKQQGKQPAVKIGLDYFGPKMKSIIEEVERILASVSPQQNKIVVHCWRGGMRSAGVAWLLDLYGYEVQTIVGGYKAFRTWALQIFQQEIRFRVLGGYTGSGKTYIIQSILNKHQPAIDLEGIAQHKGSAFGAIGMPPQPSQEMFENQLALAIYHQTKQHPNQPIWIEDESQRIGSVNIPHLLWATIRKQPVIFIDIPFAERVKHIVSEYGSLEKEKLIVAVSRIQKRFGPNETKMTIQDLNEDRVDSAFSQLLKYYDKAYEKSLFNRENIATLLQKKPFDNVNADFISESLTSL
ncbi:MAG: tRNA 2-selenouridine(34) synthase MnmH [Bacteroidota bacterium]